MANRSNKYLNYRDQVSSTTMHFPEKPVRGKIMRKDQDIQLFK